MFTQNTLENTNVKQSKQAEYLNVLLFFKMNLSQFCMKAYSKNSVGGKTLISLNPCVSQSAVKASNVINKLQFELNILQTLC